MNSQEMLILFTAVCHLELSEISDKVLIYYKIPHTLSGRHEKTHDCSIKQAGVIFTFL